MKKLELKVETRSKTGKGISRQLRAQGLIPGIVYGKNLKATPVTINTKELAGAISGEGGQNRLITLKGEGDLNGSVIIVKDILRDPLKGTMRHVDLHQINLDEKCRVEVAINLVGTAIGVKEGGLLEITMHRLEVECLPGQIPEHIDLEIRKLAVGQSLHVRDLVLPDGVKVLEDPKAAVVSVIGKLVVEAPAAQ